MFYFFEIYGSTKLVVGIPFYNVLTVEFIYLYIDGKPGKPTKMTCLQ